MKHTDIMNEVINQTGVTRENCEVIVKAFEKTSEDALVQKFKGAAWDHETIVNRISESTGIDADTCNEVMMVLSKVMDNGLTNKLRVFKRNRPID